ncbi:Arm DNA-binding domain-containing protein [Trinickia dinghuensis]|uniref:Site-specific integrase n=1 Tax=Trinickia dinghuensis TaxID=2291023 RepID=A0A3D8K1P3_9BURK|nr:DUF3596 domain-containing protein [Trinickia dinghuensis]RDU99169.1 site-specific integrase [Trinickia dinghuensis]
MGRKGTGVTAISDSSYEIAFTYKGVRCRERVKARPCAANTKDLTKFRQRLLAEIEIGTFDYATTFPNSKNLARFAGQPGDVQLVGDYLERWLDVKKTQIAASTYRDYYGIVFRLLIPRFGKLRLSELKRPHFKEWLASIDDGRKDKSNNPVRVTNKRLANIQSCARSALQDAVDDELLEANPLAGFTFERNEAPREEDHADPFDASEQAAIIRKARAPQLANLFQFLFWTGLRTSEVIALNWDDVDWHHGTIRVRKAMTRASKGTTEDTKTIAGRRDVKLLAPALAALNAQKAHTLLQPDGAIFHNPGWRGRGGGRWKGDNQIWKVWGTTLKNAKVRYRNPYQTRHTYASMMLSAGESEMWVAKQMGHASTAPIRRNYGRWMPTADPHAGERAVARFAEGFDSNLPASDAGAA